jgi:iron complex transport system permease protein
VLAPRAALLRLAWITPLALLVIVASSFFGYTSFDWRTPTGWREFITSDLYWDLRVPRVKLAAFAGAGLALGGAVFQCLFRNPLAEPYTLGIASGASLGAGMGFLFNVTGYVFWLPKLGVFALVGGLVAMTLVLLLARLRAGQDMTRLLLAGVCIAYTCNAGILLVTFLARKPVTNDLVMWMMGSLSLVRWQSWVEVAVALGLVTALAIYVHRALDLLTTSDHLAAARGVAVGRTVWTAFGAVGALTAVIVANCGPIGFVGLMVPHIVRSLLGLHAITLVLGSVLLGAAFLTVCDGVARAASSQELPVGVITNILGTTFFFGLLTRGSEPSAK